MRDTNAQTRAQAGEQPELGNTLILGPGAFAENHCVPDLLQLATHTHRLIKSSRPLKKWALTPHALDT